MREKIASSAKQFQNNETDIKTESFTESKAGQKSAAALNKKSKEIYQQKLKNREAGDCIMVVYF